MVAVVVELVVVMCGGVVVVVVVQYGVSVGVTQRSGQHVICVVKLVAHSK